MTDTEEPKFVHALEEPKFVHALEEPKFVHALEEPKFVHVQAQEKLDNLLDSIEVMSRGAFDRQCDHLFSISAEEKWTTSDFLRQVLILSMTTSFEFVKRKVEEVTNDLTKSGTSERIVEQVKDYMETCSFRRLELYSRTVPRLAQVERSQEADREVEAIKEEPKAEDKPESSNSKEDKKPEKKEMSPDLKKKVEDMMKSMPKHVSMYPPQHKPGALLVPTGRMLKCVCRPGCDVDLCEPEYRVINPDSDEGRWCIDSDKPKKGARAKKATKKNKRGNNRNN